jgi:hypothetical protein
MMNVLMTPENFFMRLVWRKPRVFVKMKEAMQTDTKKRTMMIFKNVKKYPVVVVFFLLT